MDRYKESKSIETMDGMILGQWLDACIMDMKEK